MLKSVEFPRKYIIKSIIILYLCIARGQRNFHVDNLNRTRYVKGVHDLYFVFKGGDGELMNFNWWSFK